MRASVPRLLLHLAAHLVLYGRSRSTRPAAFLLRFQSLDAVLLEALFPAGDCRRGSAQCLVDLHVAEAIGQGGLVVLEGHLRPAVPLVSLVVGRALLTTGEGRHQP